MTAQLSSHKPTGIWKLSSLQQAHATASKSSKPVAELRSQHWAFGLNLLSIFSLLQPRDRTDVPPTSWGKERHKAKMKNSPRDLHSNRVSTLLAGPALQARALTTGWCSIPERVRKQKAHDAQGESGTGFNDRHFSHPGVQVRLPVKVCLCFDSHTLLHLSVPVTMAGHKIQHLVPSSSLPLACQQLLKHISGVVHYRNSAAKLHATCSTRTAQLGTEECDRSVIKSDLSRQFHHKTHLLPHKLKQKLLWGRLLLGWCQQQLLHHSNRNDGRVLKSFTRY